MQSTARCANCGGREFEYEPPTRHLQIPGGYKGTPPASFTFGRDASGNLGFSPTPHPRGGWPIVDNYKPQLCCTNCGYWEKTWSPAREGSPKRARADQTMGLGGNVPGNMVPAENQ